MIHTGDHPGEGIYICNECGTSIKLETDTVKMPECPKCGNTEFTATK